MPSHMQKDYLDKGLPIPGDYTLEDIKANDHADALAEEAAKRQQVMPQVAATYLHHHFKAKSFQRRFIDIVQSLPKRNFSKLSPHYTPTPSTPRRLFPNLSPPHQRFYRQTHMQKLLQRNKQRLTQTTINRIL